jgi:hypothetical protein
MSKAVTLVNTPNKTQNFYPADDQWILTTLPMKASTAMPDGSAIGVEIVSNTTTGNNTLMGVENAAGADFVGILAEPIVSTDADYATAGKLKSVWIPRTPTAKAYFTVGAGTFTAVDINKTVEFFSDSKSLAVDTAGKGARIVSYISATRGVCVFPMPNTETA